MRIISELNAPILSGDLNDKALSIDAQRLKPGKYGRAESSPSIMSWIVAVLTIEGDTVTVHEWTNAEANKIFPVSGATRKLAKNIIAFVGGAIVMLEPEDNMAFDVSTTKKTVYLQYDHSNKTCQFKTATGYPDISLSVEEWSYTIKLGVFTNSSIELDEDAYRKPPAEDSEKFGGMDASEYVTKTEITNKSWVEINVWPNILALLKSYFESQGWIKNIGGQDNLIADMIWAPDKNGDVAPRDGSWIMDYDNLKDQPATYQPGTAERKDNGSKRIYISDKAPGSSGSGFSGFQDGDIWLQYYN